MAIILMVDDPMLKREFLMTLPGYGGLLEAADGVERLKMMHAAHPDPLISAILTQHTDGYESVKQLREGVSANDAGRMR